MTANTNILISGAGIAGLTLAYWLQKFGFSPTLVEKRPDLRDAGYMIDFYGSGFDVAEKMNLLEALQAKSDQYQITKLSFVDRGGRPRATLDVVNFRELLHHRYFPLMRGDLELAIYESVKSRVPIRFATRVTSLEVQPDGVAVEFLDRKSERYDLVIGGGWHSFRYPQAVMGRRKPIQSLPRILCCL